MLQKCSLVFRGLLPHVPSPQVNRAMGAQQVPSREVALRTRSYQECVYWIEVMCKLYNLDTKVNPFVVDVRGEWSLLRRDKV
jgi:hypothetical protein